MISWYIYIYSYVIIYIPKIVGPHPNLTIKNKFSPHAGPLHIIFGVSLFWMTKLASKFQLQNSQDEAKNPWGPVGHWQVVRVNDSSCILITRRSVVTATNTLLWEHIKVSQHIILAAGIQVCHPLKVRDEERISGMRFNGLVPFDCRIVSSFNGKWMKMDGTAVP